MFNVGGMELVAIGLVALVVLGPDRLPGALRQAGSVLGQLRRIADGFRVDLTSAMERAEAEVAAEAGPSGSSASPDPPGDSVAAAERLAS